MLLGSADRRCIIVWSILDLKRLQRKARARIGLAVLFVLTWAVWGGGYAWQTGYDRASAAVDSKIDFTDPGYAEPLVLYIFYGAFDATWQL